MVIVERTPYKSIEIMTDEEEVVTISEGQKIKFVTENDGELKEGVVVGYKGSKPEKVEIEMIPIGKSHVERWMVTDMVEGSLKLVSENDQEKTDEDNEEDDYEE